MTLVVTSAVEGMVDESVILRLIREAGWEPGPVYGKKGKDAIRLKIGGYNNAAQRSPWLVLVDLDDAAPCAPPLHASWLPAPAPLMRFRIAVRAVEAWLIADRERFARFLGVRQGALPHDPDAVDDPKQLVVDLARQSSRSDVRADLVPRAGSGRKVGQAYASRMIEFAESRWRPPLAAQASDSLSRCRSRLAEFAAIA